MHTYRKNCLTRFMSIALTALVLDACMIGLGDNSGVIQIPVSSGMTAWSEFFSCLNCMLPSNRTTETVLCIAAQDIITITSVSATLLAVLTVSVPQYIRHWLYLLTASASRYTEHQMQIYIKQHSHQPGYTQSLSALSSYSNTTQNYFQL